jgi:hypothetical protein
LELPLSGEQEFNSVHRYVQDDATRQRLLQSSTQEKKGELSDISRSADLIL